MADDCNNIVKMLKMIYFTSMVSEFKIKIHRYALNDTPFHGNLRGGG